MKAFLRKLLLSCISLVITLGILEIVFRKLEIRLPDPRRETWQSAMIPPEQRIQGFGVRFYPHSNFKIVYDGNVNGYSENSISYSMNNYGFRGADLTMEKMKQAKRIIVLGDSFTMGDGVKEEDTFCRKLEQDLRKEIPTIEVLNFGISGWDTQNEIRFLQTEGIKFGPDLVIVAYVLNDSVFETGPPDDLREEYKKDIKTDRHGSYVLNYVFNTYERYRLSHKYIQDLVDSPVKYPRNWNRSLNSLVVGSHLAHRAGAQYMVCIFPFLYQLDDDHPLKPLYDIVIRSCFQHKIPVLNLFDAYKGINYPELWVHPSDQHPNVRAHKIAAQALAQFILKDHLLK
jgi:hypothetical protein